jgi:hypothetical protein
MPLPHERYTQAAIPLPSRPISRGPIQRCNHKNVLHRIASDPAFRIHRALGTNASASSWPRSSWALVILEATAIRFLMAVRRRGLFDDSPAERDNSDTLDRCADHDRMRLAPAIAPAKPALAMPARSSATYLWKTGRCDGGMKCHALTWRVGVCGGLGASRGHADPISWGGLRHEYRIHRVHLGS